MLEAFRSNAVHTLDVATECLSVFGALALLHQQGGPRLLISVSEPLHLQGTDHHRKQRGELRQRSLARQLANHLNAGEVRRARSHIDQSLILRRAGQPVATLSGSCSLTTGGLGLAPPESLGFIHRAESNDELRWLASWFAVDLQNSEAIRVFAKLPKTFRITTPLGTYKPDWAIARDGGSTEVHLVVETEGNLNTLRDAERDQIACGKAHLES